MMRVWPLVLGFQEQGTSHPYAAVVKIYGRDRYGKGILKMVLFLNSVWYGNANTLCV